MLKKLKRWAAINLVGGGGVLALAGEWKSPILWTFVGGMAALTLYALLVMKSGLDDERFHPPSPGLDPIALRWIRISAIAAVVIATLDGGRFHWTPPPSDFVRMMGVVGALLAFGFAFRAMVANRFFSVVIRIQDDRGHRVVDSGPYALIRHPGYAGMITGVPLMALGFGSWLGFAVAGTYSLLILRRVAVEDRFLRANLPGYSEYATKVTSRLLPNVW